MHAIKVELQEKRGVAQLTKVATGVKSLDVRRLLTKANKTVESDGAARSTAVA